MDIVLLFPLNYALKIILSSWPHQALMDLIQQSLGKVTKVIQSNRTENLKEKILFSVKWGCMYIDPGPAQLSPNPVTEDSGYPMGCM